MRWLKALWRWLRDLPYRLKALWNCRSDILLHVRLIVDTERQLILMRGKMP